MLPYLKRKVYAHHSTIQSQCRWFLPRSRTHTHSQLPTRLRKIRQLLRTQTTSQRHTLLHQITPTHPQAPLPLPIEKPQPPSRLQNRSLGKPPHFSASSKQPANPSGAKNNPTDKIKHNPLRLDVHLRTKQQTALRLTLKLLPKTPQQKKIRTMPRSRQHRLKIKKLIKFIKTSRHDLKK